MAINIDNNISYQLSLNVLKALGGDTSKNFQSVEEIWDDINEIYDNAGDRLDIQALILDIKNNGVYEYYPTETADAYSPVKLNVNIPQKYTEEYIQELEKSVFQEGYNEGNEEGYRDGYTAGNTDGFTDGYAEGLDDGTEQQKALLSEVTVKENGVYEREDGYKKVHVEVDIPTFETETLSVELTENGTHTYTPTTDGFSSVEVSVNVDIPDVTPADLRNLIVEVKENKDYEFLPTDYDGWNKVNVTVNVPTGGGGDNPLSELGYSESDISRLDYISSTAVAYTKTKTLNVNARQQFANDYKLIYGPSSDIQITSLESTFQDCFRLQTIPTYNLSKCTSLYMTFYRDRALISLPELDIPLTTTLDNAFQQCSALRTVSLKNTNSVTSSKYCFDGCYTLEEISIDLPVTNYVDSMFGDCWSLHTVSLNIPSATTLYNTFKNCKKLKNVTLTVGTALTSCEGAFSNSGIENAPLFDTSSVTKMNSMFTECASLKTIPQYDTGKVTNMQYFLNYCTSLESLPMLNTSSVTNMSNLTRRSKLTEFPQWDCSKVTTCGSMFNDPENLVSVPELDFSSVTSMNYLFGSSSSSGKNLTNLGGFRNLGSQSSLSGTNSYFLNVLPNLTHESLMNVINGLYDRKSAGYSTVTLKFGSTNLAKLTDEEKSLAVAKGWTLAT